MRVKKVKYAMYAYMANRDYASFESQQKKIPLKRGQFDQ